MVSNLELIEIARSWVGVPFLHQGRSRRGVDCVGFIIVLAEHLKLVNMPIIRPDYGRAPPTGELERKIAGYCEPANELIPGVIVVIRFSRYAQHCALFTGDTLIHSYERVGRVVEHGFRGAWIRRTVSMWKIPGVIYG